MKLWSIEHGRGQKVKMKKTAVEVLHYICKWIAWKYYIQCVCYVAMIHWKYKCTATKAYQVMPDYVFICKTKRTDYLRTKGTLKKIN